MSRLTNANPTYRRHHASGQAVVALAGVDHYLGPHGTKASRNEYDRVVGEWLANGRRPARTAADDLTVAEAFGRFRTHAVAYYVARDGTPTKEADMFRLAMRPLVRMYGGRPAAEFGPPSLDCVRGAMVDAGGCRTYINAQVWRVRMVFKWAVGKELVPAGVLHGLSAVAGLRAGRAGGSRPRSGRSPRRSGRRCPTCRPPSPRWSGCNGGPVPGRRKC